MDGSPGSGRRRASVKVNKQEKSPQKTSVSPARQRSSPIKDDGVGKDKVAAVAVKGPNAGVSQLHRGTSSIIQDTATANTPKPSRVNRGDRLRATSRCSSPSKMMLMSRDGTPNEPIRDDSFALKTRLQRSSRSQERELLKRGTEDPLMSSPQGNIQQPSTGNDKTGVPTHVFGDSLEEVIARQKARGIDLEVPSIVQWTIKNLRERGMYTSGIFRQSGHHGDQISLQKLVDAGASEGALNLASVDPHTVGALLRSYLRSLPEPVVPRVPFFPLLVQVAAFSDETFRLSSYRSLLLSIPPHNYQLLKHLSEFLRDVAAHGEVNLMTVSNLALVFAPTIFGTIDNDLYVRKDAIDSMALFKESKFTSMLVEEILSSADFIFSAGAEPAAAYHCNESFRPVEAHHVALLRGDMIVALHSPSDSEDVTVLIGDSTGKVSHSLLLTMEPIPLQQVKTKEIASLFTNKVVNTVAIRTGTVMELPNKKKESKKPSFLTGVLRISSASKKLNPN